MVVSGGATALLGWLFLGACGFARETVWCDGTSLFVRQSIFGWGNTRSYLLAHMAPLRPPEPGAVQRPEAGAVLAVYSGGGPLRPAAWPPPRKGGVVFRYADTDVVLGSGMDEARSRGLAEALASRFGLRLGTGTSGV